MASHSNEGHILLDVDLTVGSIVSNAFSIGLKNAGSLIGATILWLLTIWIPYLNIGTTIAMLGIVIGLGRGGVMSPMEIFDRRYRMMMGEVFLLMGLKLGGVLAGVLFAVIPGIVIRMSWSQSLFLLLDRQMNPTEALTMSNRITHGHKWTIFFGYLVLGIVYAGLAFAITLIGQSGATTLSAFLLLVWAIVSMPVALGAAAHIYAVLSRRIDLAVQVSAEGSVAA
jgi:hypothetical protein